MRTFAVVVIMVIGMVASNILLHWGGVTIPEGLKVSDFWVSLSLVILWVSGYIGGRIDGDKPSA